eukprot:5606831-Prymnesium_polylepis.1
MSATVVLSAAADCCTASTSPLASNALAPRPESCCTRTFRTRARSATKGPVSGAEFSALATAVVVCMRATPSLLLLALRNRAIIWKANITLNGTASTETG